MRSPRRHRRSAKWLPKVLAVLWSACVGACFFLLVLQYTQVTTGNTLELPSILSTTRNSNVITSYNTTTKSFQRNSGNQPFSNEPQGSQEQQIQRQQAARENQAWVARRFELAHRLAPQSSQQATISATTVSNTSSLLEKEEGVSSSKSAFTWILPSWLASGAQNKVHVDEKIDFIEKDCKDFQHNTLRPDHGCQINPDTLQIFCAFSNLRINNSRIHVDQGGERLEDVMGRSEAAEFPVYEEGAFSTRPKPKFEVPKEYQGMKQLHYMEDVLNSLQYPTTKNKGEFDSSCVETREGTTFMLTRYEYVNLYHTLTDWWNFFFVLTSEQRDHKEKFRILFLDGHAQGNLDSVWTDVFGPFEYVQHLPPGGVCFERAIFIPPGYVATLFPDAGTDGTFSKQRLRCPVPRFADEFSSFFLKAYDLEQLKTIPGKVVIIDRKPYVSHPRSQAGSFGRVMTGLQELKDVLIGASGVTSVEIIRLETMSFAEQVKAVRGAQILIGNHGAGLTHLLFMDRNSHVVEFSLDYRDFFFYLAEWKGIHHVPIAVSDENILTSREITVTVDMVSSLLVNNDG